MNKVLLLEDDMIIQLFVEEALSKINLDVTSFDSADEVISLEDFTEYSLIICDIGLNHSKFNGLDVAKIISTKCHTRIVFMSGNSDKYSLKDLDEASIDYTFIKKPIDEKSLVKIISGLF